MNGGKKHSTADFCLLYLAFLIFSLTSVFGKLAAGQDLFSPHFILFYGLELFILLVYAVLWQKVLKRFDLSVAYANRPVVTVLSMLWGILLFHEQLTWNMVVGTFIIAFGIMIIIRSEGE